LGAPLFLKRSDRPMNVAVFGSGSGMILRAMLAAQRQARQPFSIRLLYTDRECFFQKIAKEENLPLIYNPFNPAVSRENFDLIGLDLVRSYSRENPCPIDFLLLAGYMRLMSRVWLRAFPHRILNIHPGDLTVLDKEGNRKFVGDRAVFKALQNGERKTRTTAILIDEKVDGGPVLVSGPWVPYEGEDPVTKESAAKHQEKQKKVSDYPACLAALQMLAEGRFELSLPAREVFLDGRKMEPCGYELMEGGHYVWNHWDSRS
jgi:phosphoribosylglycinamide formyltransferase 1